MYEHLRYQGDESIGVCQCGHRSACDAATEDVPYGNHGAIGRERDPACVRRYPMNRAGSAWFYCCRRSCTRFASNQRGSETIETALVLPLLLLVSFGTVELLLFLASYTVSDMQTAVTWSPSNTVGSTVTVKVTLTFSTGIPAAGLRTLTASTTDVGTVLE